MKVLTSLPVNNTLREKTSLRQEKINILTKRTLCPNGGNTLILGVQYYPLYAFYTNVQNY